MSCLLLALSFVLLTGCVAGEDDDDNGGDGGGASSETTTIVVGAKTNEDGIARASFSIPDGSTKLGVMAQPSQGSIRYTSFTSTNDTSYLSQEVSFSAEAQSVVNTISVPSRDVDPALETSTNFQTSVRVTSGGSGIRGADINFTVISKKDTDLNSGSLRVNVFLVGDVAQSDGNRRAVENAIGEMNAIFRNAGGISVQSSVFDVAGPNLLPDPTVGSDFIFQTVNPAPSPGVNILVGGDISDFDGGVFGIAASIPGPPLPTAKSAVAVSLLAGAGSDGSFSSEEVRLLGETFAHESGHFMGLFHPVDFVASFASDQDPLGDTGSCSVRSECESNANLIENVMYFTPVVNDSGELVSQNKLTGQQRAVLNRYIAVE